MPPRASVRPSLVYRPFTIDEPSANHARCQADERGSHYANAATVALPLLLGLELHLVSSLFVGAGSGTVPTSLNARPIRSAKKR